MVDALYEHVYISKYHCEVVSIQSRKAERRDWHSRSNQSQDKSPSNGSFLFAFDSRLNH